MVVFKFGGKSLSTFEKIKSLAKYVCSRIDKEQIIVVVSAMGDTTNELLDMAGHFSSTSSREVDALISTGEQQSASLFALALQQEGVSAQSFAGWQLPILTEGKAGCSHIVGIAKQVLEESIKEGKVPIVAGFQGVNEKGEITTLGRGGSDTTAVALGAIFDCKVEIYSDFDGIYTADPRKFNGEKIDEISFDTMIKLSQSGAKVLSADAALLAKQKNVPLECKASATPEKTGTFLSAVPKPVSALNVKENLCQLDLVFDCHAIDLASILADLTQKEIFESINLTKHTLSVTVAQQNLNAAQTYLLKKIHAHI